MNRFKKIMLIDDHDVSLFITQHILQKLNYEGQTILMPSGFSALNYFNENIDDSDKLPDLILLDIQMPLVDGWDFLNQFQKIKNIINKKTHIFVLSGQDNSIKCNELKSMNLIDGHFIKPFQIANMKSILETINKL